MEWDEAQQFPDASSSPKLAGARADGHPVPRGVRRRRRCRRSTTASASRSWRASCPAVALSVAAHNGLCSAHICDVRHRGAEAAATCRRWRAGEMLGAWGLTEAGRRQRRRRHADDRRARRRRLGAQRREDVHHPRHDRRRDGGHGGDRSRQGQPRHLGVHRRARHAGHAAGQEGEQARHARERHQRGDLRRLPRPGRRSCSARKGRASSTRCRCSTPGASASPRCRSAWRRAPTRRRCDYAQERRQFGQPIAAFQAIQWKLADNATRIEAARLLTYRAAYLKDQRRAHDARVVDGQAVRQRDRGQGRRRLRADPRRLRLREGLSGREVLPRREALTIGEGTSEIQRLVIARQLLAQ